MLIRNLLISGTTNKPKPHVNKCLLAEEDAKFVRDGKERGWFMLDTPANCMKPNRHATNITRQIILAKINADRRAGHEFRQQ